MSTLLPTQLDVNSWVQDNYSGLVPVSVATTSKARKIKKLAQTPGSTPWYTSGPMIPFFVGIVSCLGVFFRSRYNLGLEIFALRQQLGVLKRRRLLCEEIGNCAAALRPRLAPF